ncbi:hypothetical protein CONLIGDRAFT_684697 [Coniochaeta ligniaria NRRL 30616]|uniref:RBR-type E3 ubiquitin transferase n=1 Tax=Coniochaeta ligniaria NRRL 30616 TaxID=1408157 RepID=A0A1J7IFH7_9PEZI|nr:hypothetical protein CONLIGDRAFT_684697 [Coniochaeta ligniaria NRRL 30616]
MSYRSGHRDAHHRRPPDDHRRHGRRHSRHHGAARATAPEAWAAGPRPELHRQLPRPGPGPPEHRQRANDPPDDPPDDAPAPDFHQPNPNGNLTAAEHSASDASSAGGPEDAACLVCIRVARRRARLPCGHTWCRRCLRTQVRNALRGGDGAWPPRCCRGEGGEIREGAVEWLGDRGVLDMYRRRRTETGVAVRDRVYCHLITCASFIPLVHHTLAGDRGRGGRIALCQEPGCSRHTCVDCGTQAHVGRECPRDPDMEAVLQTIEAHGYQFCARCNAVVERIDGCNHITCRCGYQFCYMCGTRWKECSCPGYGGMRRQRADRPRLEQAVRGQITTATQPAADGPVAQPRPTVAPARQPRYGDPAYELALLMPQDDGTRERWEREDAEARRLAEQMRMWTLEDHEAGRPAPARAPQNDEDMRRLEEEDAEARAQAEQMRLWAQEDAEARRRAGQPMTPAPAPAPVPPPTPARAPAAPPPVVRGVRDESPERPGGNTGRIEEGRLPYPEAAYLIAPGIGMRELEDHMYHQPPELPLERQLQERARLERAQWMRAQQQYMLGGYPPPIRLGGLPGSVAGGWVVPRVLGPGSYQNELESGGEFGGQDIGQHPPGIDMRMMMYQQAMGGNMPRRYEYHF